MPRQSRYNRLRQLSDRDLPASTIRYAKRYVADYPDHGPGWLRLGIALVELARYEEAERALRKALELCPPEQRQIPLSHLGHLFKQAGDYDVAAAWFRKALEAKPGDATYQIYLGCVLARQGHLREAEEVHRVAVSCATGCIDEAHLNLGLVLRAQERFEEAADCFREAIRLDPKYREARRALRDVERCIRWGEPRNLRQPPN